MAFDDVTLTDEDLALSDNDVTDLHVLLSKLELELESQTDADEPFGGMPVKQCARVENAKKGVTSIDRYLHWRENTLAETENP